MKKVLTSNFNAFLPDETPAPSGISFPRLTGSEVLLCGQLWEWGSLGVFSLSL